LANPSTRHAALPAAAGLPGACRGGRRAARRAGRGRWPLRPAGPGAGSGACSSSARAI